MSFGSYRNPGHATSISLVIRFVVLSFAMLTFLSSSPCSAQVVVLTVGPQGTYPTIQDALDHVVSGWTNKVHIQAGTYYENVVITNAVVSLAGGEIELSGGWNSDFTVQNSDPSSTVVDADDDGTCVFVDFTAAGYTTFRLSTLTLANGVAEAGGGLYFNATGLVKLAMANTVLSNNLAETTVGPSEGGGMFVSASGIGNTLEVFDSIFAGNTARPPGGVGQANGGGASVRINGGLNATFKGVTFDGNTIEGTASEQGAGLFLVVDNDGTAEIQNAHFSSNQAVASTGGPLVAGIGLYVYAGGTSVVEVDQVTIVDNLSQTGGGSQFFAWVLNYGWVDVRDLLTTGGHTGAGVSASGDTSVALTNLTVTDNATTGLYVSREDLTADLSFDNSILYGNGVDLYVANLTPAASNNLVGVNPGFVDPAAGNYRLAPGSPAENAGTNSPAAGLGTADCGGGVRVIDGVVDIGAFEGVDLIFSDTFEWQHTNRWSDTVGGTDCIGAPAVP